MSETEKNESHEGAQQVVVVGLTVKTLKQIEEHLRSIKSMLTFFVVLAVLGMILSFCTALGL